MALTACTEMIWKTQFLHRHIRKINENGAKQKAKDKNLYHSKVFFVVVAKTEFAMKQK